MTTLTLADMFAHFLQRDFAAAGSGVLAAVVCGMVGSFLVLRRMSLMGDAISHAVLPGLIAAFVLTDSLAALPIFVGAAAVGILTTALTETVHRVGKVESNASMGVVFTVLFAIGVIWLERIGGRSVHIDADCILYGNMQNVIWPTAPERLAGLFAWDTLADMPRQVQTLLVVLAVNTVFIVLLFKELRITSFDPALATAQGINPWIVHYALMTVMAVSTVASFEAVGSILVVAMLIVPGVCARLLTDRLGPLVVLAGVIALLASAGGYAIAAWASLDATGTVGLTLGGVLALVGLFSPRYGWVSSIVRRATLARRVIAEDVLAVMYRLQERGRAGAVPRKELVAAAGDGWIARAAIRHLRRAGALARATDDAVELTPLGRRRAIEIVRSHRLWESYLVGNVGLRADHVHATAMRLEHVTDEYMRDRLAARVADDSVDPHGRAIPPASEPDA